MLKYEPTAITFCFYTECTQRSVRNLKFCVMVTKIDGNMQYFGKCFLAQNYMCFILTQHGSPYKPWSHPGSSPVTSVYWSIFRSPHSHRFYSPCTESFNTSHMCCVNIIFRIHQQEAIQMSACGPEGSCANSYHTLGFIPAGIYRLCLQNICGWHCKGNRSSSKSGKINFAT
jgi:hypothetical protein